MFEAYYRRLLTRLTRMGLQVSNDPAGTADPSRERIMSSYPESPPGPPESSLSGAA